MQFTRLIALVASLHLAALSAQALSQTSGDAPTSRPTTAPSGDFAVHEWVIFACDPFQPKASSDTMFATTLPEFATSRRKAAPTTQSSEPHPVGVIRFVGTSDSKIDVKLQVTGGGRLMAAWPKPRSRSGNVLWRDIALSRDPVHVTSIEDRGSWLNALRADEEAAYVTADSVSERFLLYDAEHNYTLPLKLAGGKSSDDPVRAGNVGTVSLHDVAFYRPIAGAMMGAWQSGFLAELPAGKKRVPTTVPSTSPSTAPSTAPTTVPATAPSSAPSAVSDVDAMGIELADIKAIQMERAPSTGTTELFADWKVRLAREGVTRADCDIIIKILAKHALDSKRLTVVYRLDPAELDRMLPMEVIPQPKTITRVGLVIVRNIDPGVTAEIDELIALLGDRDWKTREAASKSLASLGQAAKSKLQSATKNSDPEIAMRADRLLATMEK